MIVLDEDVWTVVKEDKLITVMYLMTPKMVLHPHLLDLAELSFVVTSAHDLQINMAGQPILVLFGRKNKK
jgi:hypothetical protein